MLCTMQSNFSLFSRRRCCAALFFNLSGIARMQWKCKGMYNLNCKINAKYWSLYGNWYFFLYTALHMCVIHIYSHFCFNNLCPSAWASFIRTYCPCGFLSNVLFRPLLWIDFTSQKNGVPEQMTNEQQPIMFDLLEHWELGNFILWLFDFVDMHMYMLDQQQPVLFHKFAPWLRLWT